MGADLELVVGGRPVLVPRGVAARQWPRASLHELAQLPGRGKAEALEAVLRVGFVLLSGLSAVPGRVLEVAASFGYVTETNWPAVRRAGGTSYQQPGLHQPGDPAAHRQPVPRPGADRAAAALPARGRGRGRHRAGRRVRGRGRFPRRRPGIIRHAGGHPFRSVMPVEKPDCGRARCRLHPGASPSRPGTADRFDDRWNAAAAAAVRRGHRVLRRLQAVG